jgi:hypothetical protein
MSSIPPNPAAPQGASDVPGRPAPLSSDQLLPPVEPPSAGFLLQLFVVPAVIVACVVLVWFLIESLARRGEQDPAAIVRALRSNQGYQKANDLAVMLQIPERYPELRTNRELASGIADYLDQLIDAHSDDDSTVRMRYVLVSALGMIEVPEGAPALIKAAVSDANADVRRMAIHQLSVLLSTLALQQPPHYVSDDQLVTGLQKLSLDEDDQLRSWSAVALGWAALAPEADPRIEDALRVLADDPYTDARFNAAEALARMGSPRAAAALAEMFDPESIAASLRVEEGASTNPTDPELRSRRVFKRNTIVNAALRAVEMLLEHKQTRAALAPVETALDRFIAAAPTVQEPAPVPSDLLEAAKRTLAKVQAAKS